MILGGDVIALQLVQFGEQKREPGHFVRQQIAICQPKLAQTVDLAVCGLTELVILF